MTAGEDTGPSALEGSFLHFVAPHGPDLLARTAELRAWTDRRREAGLWLYGRSLERAPGATTSYVEDGTGRRHEGINLSSQDYLGLASHPEVHEAAVAALRDFGPHSASSGALAGGTTVATALAEEIGSLVGMENILLFPTGWGVGFGAVVGLVRPYDHIVMDALSHASLQQGASSATPQIRRHRHLDVDAATEELKAIRRDDTENGILVITEGLFSMDSDWPDLRTLQERCREYGATLFVDVAHDLFASGPGGTGQPGAQEVLGELDLVMGAFSKTCASTGGFLAAHSPAVTEFVSAFGGSWTFSNSLSPVQSAVALQAIRICRSAEGDSLRAKVAGNAARFRAELATHGIDAIGQPSPIVPIPIGDDGMARIATAKVFAKGVMPNLVEFPAVAAGKARFRAQLMATHSEEQLVEAARIIAEAIDEARAEQQDQGAETP